MSLGSQDATALAGRPPLTSVCVFCGSSLGARPAYADLARRLGETLAAGGIRLVYGGGRVGLMGVVADAVLAAGGRVVGIIPEALASKEIAHAGLTELHVVDSMHTRKAMMADFSGAFVALPGGFGTLEEFAEILTWAQLGIHMKPFGLLDVDGFYAGLTAFFDHMVAERFLHPAHRGLVLHDTEPDRLLDRLAAFTPVENVKWIGPEER